MGAVHNVYHMDSFHFLVQKNTEAYNYIGF